MGTEERETLWLDMLTQYKRLNVLWGLSEDEREEQLLNVASHYLGTIVLSGPSALGVPRSDVIDGQQRITTLMLALSALRDAWASSSERGKERRPTVTKEKRKHLTNTYLRNPGRWQRSPPSHTSPSTRRHLRRSSALTARGL